MENMNTMIYTMLLDRLLNFEAENNSHGISYEMCPAFIEFEGIGLIEGTNLSYVQHELDWYKTQDRNINGHPGIESNKIWKQCATEDGNVNSNYGWCIFASDNCDQFDNAIKSLALDSSTKQAIMVYSRPEIQYEHNDDRHAHRDMICTIYTNFLIRKSKLNLNVHMRSNDVWYGLRNDLAWQQFVLRHARSVLKDKYDIPVELGKINWFADSLHLYSRNEIEAQHFVISRIGKYPTESTCRIVPPVIPTFTSND